jgi:hypothetical protein
MEVIKPIRIGFLVYCAALFATAFSYAKARALLRKKQYYFAILFLGLCAVSMMAFIHSDSKPVYAASGTPKGIFPGRVAWVYNPEAAKWDGATGYYWQGASNKQSEYNAAFTRGIMALSGGTNDADAWDKIFRWFNNNNGRAGTGYQSTDKIAIKINQNNDSIPKAHSANNHNANPQSCVAVVRSLVNAGVPEANIYIGDPSRGVSDSIYQPLKNAFPNVHVVSYFNTNGREKFGTVANAFPTTADGLVTSMVSCFYDARYIINMPLLKGHEGQTITFGAKNYYGILGISNDWRINNPKHPNDPSNTQFMTHQNFGRKTILWCMDAMYSNKFLSGTPTAKVTNANFPFNGKPMSSFIMSLDGVAEEAVSYDFWSTIYGVTGGTGYMTAAASAGAGTFDHWDGPSTRRYAKNINPAAIGIELVTVVLPDYPTISFSSSTLNVTENSGSITVNVDRSNVTTTAVGVSYATTNGTATAGADYTSTSGTLTFAAGVTRQAITIPISGDALIEGSENLSVTLSNPTNGAVLGSIPTAAITIVDDDQTRYPVPGIVQAEDYMLGGEAVAYHDLTAGNSGNVYRTDNVDIQACADVGGGYNVGWTQTGEWLNYLVTVTQADNYTFLCRVASGAAGTKTLQVAIDGVNVGGTISFTSAAGWQTWVDASSTPVLLAAGNHTMKVSFGANDINLNYVNVKSSNINVPPVVAITAPAHGAIIPAPAQVTVTATASDADGSVSQVALEQNGSLVSAITTPPYSWLLTNLPAGVYTLKATATDNKNATTNASIMITVMAVPAAPTLTAPVNNAANLAVNPTLSWNAVSGASTYRVQVSGDNTFATTIVDDATLTSPTKAISGLNWSTAYYWRVSATNAAGTSAYSAAWSFTVQAPQIPPAPTLSAPANAATGVAVSPTLSWNAASGATAYQVQVSTDAAFTTTIVDDATLTATTKALSGLAYSTTYYWRVNARNVAGTSAWPTAFSFTTGSLSVPVTITLNPTKDAYVKSGVNAAINYGTATVLEVKTQATGMDVNRQVYVTFDLSSFTGTVSAAHVRLNRSAGLANVAMTVYECSDNAWAENTLTWSNKPAAGTAVNTVTLTAVNGWYTFDVTAYVAARKAAGATAISMVLIGAEQGATAQQVFSSKEGVDKPVLQITYQSGTVVVPAAPVLATPANSAANVALSPTLTWNAVSGAATYRVQVSAVNTFATTMVDDATLTQPTKAASGLSAVTTYYWRVNATNGAGTSAWSEVWSFTTTTSTTATININPAKDAHVRGGTNAAVNYGANTAIEVKTQAADLTYTRNVYINFSLVGFTGTVSTASLQLYRTAGTANIVVTAYECADNAWGETTINWNNKPAVGAAAATATMTAANGVYTFDVTAYVRARKAAGATAITFIVIGAEQGATTQQAFSSKEGANKPVLQVVYANGLGKVAGPTSRIRKIDYALNLVNYRNSALSFTLPIAGAYRITAFSVLGEKVREVNAANGVLGFNAVRMRLPQGLYVVHLTTEKGSIQKELSSIR